MQGILDRYMIVKHFYNASKEREDNICAMNSRSLTKGL